MIPDRVYLCPLIYGQIVFYCRLLSCTIRADGISVNGGIHRHRPVCVEVVPLLVVGEPALHWLPISVIAPLAAVILLPAVCGLRVNDDLHKPPQDGGDFSAGGGSLGGKAVICLASCMALTASFAQLLMFALSAKVTAFKVWGRS